MKLELRENMYIRTNEGIRKILNEFEEGYELDRCLHYCYPEGHDLYKEDLEDDENKIVTKSSFNIIDLVELMDLLVIENEVKDIEGKKKYFFNPVRCDGFAIFENDKRCMIINMDYIVPVENIKIYKVLTHEQFEHESYKVGE